MGVQGTITNKRLGKITRFIRIFRNGVKYHYPICCVFRFSFEDALKDGKTFPAREGLAVKRGLIKRDNGSEFVPCNLFHHKTESF